MRKPATTNPAVPMAQNEPRIPRQSSRFGGKAGGKMSSSRDDMAGDTQVVRPQEMPDGHIKTGIPHEEIFGLKQMENKLVHQGPSNLMPAASSSNKTSKKGVGKTLSAKVPKLSKL